VTVTGASGWRAGAVRTPVSRDLAVNVQRLQLRFPVAIEHQRSLARLGSQIVYASNCKEDKFLDCGIALVRFSGAIESAFGLTREILIFYSPHQDLQIRTFHAAKRALAALPREITPDMMFMWAPDARLRDKLEDWSTGHFLAIPLTPDNDDDPVALISLLRDFIYSRDLFYETTPVRGDRFFGRRQLLQSLRDDVHNQRVAGLFGLRKAGKTSVLSQFAETISNPQTIVMLRDLESLPSPPEDPIPDLLKDLSTDLLEGLRARNLGTKELVSLPPEITLPEFKRTLQSLLRRLGPDTVRIVLMLDEIEYLTPADKIDVSEGEMASVSQFLGVLRSLVQENPNFTFLLSGLTSAIIENGRLYGRPNPLFSWAKAHFLAPFERYEADDLARSTGAKMGIDIDDGALDALFEASGGHAYLYRHLASAVVTGLPIDVYQRRMTRVDVLRTSIPWRRSIAGNLTEMLDHVRRYYPDEAVLLEVLREEPVEFAELAESLPLALEHLLNLGLVESKDRSYQFNPVLQLL
jgi:hypothetical protein